MKKLKKLRLNALRNEVLLISDDEMCRLVGGGSEYDGGWLPEVVCYGIYTYDGGWFDNGDSYGDSNYNDYWFFYFDNYGTALTNYTDYGDSSSHDNDGSSGLVAGGSSSSHQNSGGFKVIANLQSSWKRQTASRYCVPAVMSYASYILGMALSEADYIRLYKFATHSDLDSKIGVPLDKMDDYVYYNFNAEYFFSCNDMVKALDNNHPCMVTILDNDTKNLHELLVVGYRRCEENIEFKCINPGTGLYENHTMDDFGICETRIYELKSVK